MLVDLTGAILSKEDAPVCKAAKIVPLDALAFAGGLDLKPLVIDRDSGGHQGLQKDSLILKDLDFVVTAPSAALPATGLERRSLLQFSVQHGMKSLGTVHTCFAFLQLGRVSVKSAANGGQQLMKIQWCKNRLLLSDGLSKRGCRLGDEGKRIVAWRSGSKVNVHR